MVCDVCSVRSESYLFSKTSAPHACHRHTRGTTVIEISNLLSHKILNVRRVKVFWKRTEERRLATRTTTKPILKVKLSKRPGCYQDNPKPIKILKLKSNCRCKICIRHISAN